MDTKAEITKGQSDVFMAKGTKQDIVDTLVAGKHTVLGFYVDPTTETCWVLYSN